MNDDFDTEMQHQKTLLRWLFWKSLAGIVIIGLAGNYLTTTGCIIVVIAWLAYAFFVPMDVLI